MDPVSILPPEVWELIMARLPTHKEKFNAYNTCSLWRSFLEKKRTLWMFQGIFSSLFKYLPGSDILKSRLICKSWNGVIESYLEKDQSLMLSPGRHHANTGRGAPFRTLEVDFDRIANRLGLTTTQTLHHFHEQFSTADGSALSCTKNPILSRSICLTLNEVGYEVLNFFEMFGVHVYSLKLHLIQKPPHEILSPEQTVKFIWNILSLVPNLRKLALCSVFENVYATAQSKQVRIMEGQKVQLFLESNVTPSLTHLRDLHIITDIVNMRTFLENLYCSQLTKYVHTAGQKFMPTNLACVTDMAWVFLNAHAFTELNSFRNFDSPCLQRLHIYVQKHGVQNDGNPAICTLFKKIESFKWSLTHLSLRWTYFEGNFPNDLDLPLVQEISLEIESCANPRDINFFFLRSLKSLRKLTCVFWESCHFDLFTISELYGKEKNYTRADDIDLHLYLVDVGTLKSNIWRLLPSLDVIQYRFFENVFSRPTTETIIYTRAELQNDEIL